MRLPLGFQQTCDGGRATRPLGCLGRQLLSAGARQRVEPRAARVLRVPPFGVDPAGAFQPLQRDEERTGIHFEHAARDLLDATRDAEAVHRLETERFENEQVERALDDVGRRLVHRSSAAAAVTVSGFILIVKMKKNAASQRDAVRLARTTIAPISSAGSIGLARWSWKPLRSAFARSSDRAYAVSAAAGMSRSAGSA